MAKICEYCGRELAEGEACTCPQSVLLRSLHQGPDQGASAQPAPRPAFVPDESRVNWGVDHQPPAAAPADSLFQQMAEGSAPAAGPAPRSASRIRTAFRNIGPFFRAYFRAPGESIKTACTHHDLPLAVIYLLLFLVLGGLFFVTLFCRAAELLVSAVSGVGSLLQGFLGGYGGVRTHIAVPVTRTFLLGALLFAVAVALLVLAVFVAGKVGRTGGTLKSAFILCSLNTLVPSPGLILAIFMLFFSLRLTVYALLLAAVAWLVTTVLCAYQVAGAPASGRYWFALLLGVVAACILGSLLCGPIFQAALGGVSVNGAPLDTLYRQYGGYYMN